MTTIWTWLTAHPGNLLLACMIVFGLGNLVFKPKSPAEWRALSARNPRLAGLFDVLAGAWPDLVKVWSGLRTMILGRAIVAAGGDPVLLEVVSEVKKTTETETTTATISTPRDANGSPVDSRVDP